MSSLFCCLRKWAAGPVGPIPACRCYGAALSCQRQRRAGEGLLRGNAAPASGHRSRGCDTIFSTLERAGILPGWRGSFRIFAAQTASWLRPPCWDDVPLLQSSPVHSGGMFPLSCIPRCTAGDLWKNVRKQKGPPARSRWPLISRREAAAYSPATAFWCSAMTLSATGWGASS